jgi:AcrR family transcriptional regulator
MPGQRAPEDARRAQIVNAAYEVALRTGIAGVTLRAVGAEAGLSHGLLLFHFERKDELIGALLDHVLATTAMLHLSGNPVSEEAVSEDLAPLAPGPGRLAALLHRELERLAREPQGMRLFLEYWALGVRQAMIRRKIAAALERYRAAFRSLAEEMLRDDAAPSIGVTPEAIAAVAVSLINGWAVQRMIDPRRFDTDAYLAAVHRLIGRIAQDR